MAQKPTPRAAQKPASKPSAASPAKPAVKPLAAPASPPSTALRIADFLARFERFAWDFGGVFWLSLSLLTLAALLAPSLTSGLLALWGALVRRWLGYGGPWMALFAGWLGLWMFQRSPGSQPGPAASRLESTGGQVPLQPGASVESAVPAAARSSRPRASSAFWGRFLLLELAAFASLAFLGVWGGFSIERADAGLDGGQVGWGLAELTRRVLATAGLESALWSGGLLLLAFMVFLAAGLGLPARWAAALQAQLARSERASAALVDAPGLGVSEAPLQPGPAAPAAVPARKKAPILPPQFRKNFHLTPQEPASPAALPPRDERLPGLGLLVYEQYSRPDERTINQIAGLIEKTLAEFGIPAKVIDFRVGPTITQFAVSPGYVEKDRPNGEGDPAKMKVRVAQISSLGRDLALALSAERLRIEAPVPGRPYVGIEVPNPRASVVRMRPILEHEAFAKVSSPLAMALGRDVSGQPVVADLTRMPHLLIAGTTGSGKSVCIAAIATCLVINNTPDDLRLVMIDPKMVELVRFNGLPHLYGKVETDPERIQAVLRWVVVEMDRRYKVLEASHVRNIDTYNRKAQRHKGGLPMPRVVVLIDELADLMMSAPEETEHNLVRLAQMARAVGIHLVVATQRPGVDVVTGLIKANFPARISFAVASSVDSRVILDSVGAEGLLGRGDMLFLPPDASGPQRVQGVMVSDAEVDKVITFWQTNRPAPAAPDPSPWEAMLAEEQTLPDRDDLVERAIKIVRQEQRASASMLQRRLRIGYPRAARLIDELEELGAIAPASGGREREVLLEREDFSEDEEDR